MVYTTANGSAEARQAVIQSLRSQGVDISDNASAEQVIETFKEQPRAMRRTITTEVEAWNEEKFFENSPEANDATTRFEEARQDIPEIANQGGTFAVSQTVSMVQGVTGGPGSIIGGRAGAVTDLALTATEMNPTDVVQRQVTVYATGGEKQDLPTETTTTTPTEAVARIESAAEGDPNISDEEIMDAAVALMQEVSEALRSEFGPTVQIAEKVALGGGELSEQAQTDGSVQQDASLELTNFIDGEVAEVVIVREDRLAQEVIDHVLGPDNPIELTGPPLVGTVTAESSPAGDAAGGGSQAFDITADVTHVKESTNLFCQGAGVVCSPSVGQIMGDSTVSFSVDVTDEAQIRLVRHDTGESYSLNLSASASAPAPAESCSDAKAHLCENLPNVGCDISVMGNARAKVIAACGSAEANSYFAQAPSMCC
jgi:hypothetical protein